MWKRLFWQQYVNKLIKQKEEKEDNVDERHI
jgi:hypothetical protein